MTTKSLIIWTDGGSRGNPGQAACGVVFSPHAGNSRKICGKFLGQATNNEAEYEAVILALETLMSETDKPPRIEFRIDSLLVVSQLSGKWKIKEKRMQILAKKVKELEKQINIPITYVHIPREQNQEADGEVNRILDHQNNF